MQFLSCVFEKKQFHNFKTSQQNKFILTKVTQNSGGN